MKILKATKKHGFSPFLEDAFFEKIQVGSNSSPPAFIELMYLKSFQKLSTDKCYPESIMKEFPYFSASLDDLMPYYKQILSVVNSFIRDKKMF